MTNGRVPVNPARLFFVREGRVPREPGTKGAGGGVRDAALALKARLDQVGLGGDWEHDKKYLPNARWRGDLVNRALHIVVEVQGGVWGKPVVCNHCGQTVTREVTNKNGVRTIVQVREGMHHTRGKGASDDVLKHNETILAGWILLYVTADQARTAYALDLIKQAVTYRRLHNGRG